MQTYTETILLKICENLQLSTSLYEQATERYETIAKIIQKDHVFNSIELNIYPQGSFRLKTTVRPLNQNEFDLDFVAELPEKSLMTPYDLYNHIMRILKEDGIHNNMVEPKTRCVRINYANDFHMDIMPAKLLNQSSHEIIVPDKELKTWYHHSNPIGYAEWFEEQARSHIINEICLERKAKFQVEKITDQEIAMRLEPLRRAVQLVKRYRDIYCKKNKCEPVRSIVVCTLMGNIASFTGDSLQIIQSFCQYINSLILQNNGQPFDVNNPVVDEILTEKWHEGSNYQDFVNMIQELTKDVSELRRYTINKDISRQLKKMFGEDITNLAISDYSKIINEARSTGKLSVSTAGTIEINKSGIPMKKNTFYGGDCN